MKNFFHNFLLVLYSIFNAFYFIFSKKNHIQNVEVWKCINGNLERWGGGGKNCCFSKISGNVIISLLIFFLFRLLLTWIETAQPEITIENPDEVTIHLKQNFEQKEKQLLLMENSKSSKPMSFYGEEQLSNQQFLLVPLWAWYFLLYC